MIKMKLEITGHAKGTESFVSIRCSMGFSQMSIYPILKENELQNCTKCWKYRCPKM